MSELNEKLQEIKRQKDTYILPENLKKDVTAFGVTGTYEGSGGSGDVKLFETVEEMQLDPSPNEGDLAVVYREEIQPIDENSEFDSCIFPNTVVLDEAFTESISGRFRAIGGGWFDGNVDMSSSSFRFDGYGDKEVRVQYTSSDGITYTRTDGGEELQELLVRLIDTLPAHIRMKSIGATEESIHDAAFVRNKAKDEDADDSDTNYSSIAFMLECNGHRIAMLGDAFASTIEKTIEGKYRDNVKPIVCDAIKVSHHGSNGNNSKTLYNLLSSHHYFIPGGKGSDYPTWGTFGRIVESNRDEAELGVETAITEQEYELFEY